MARFTLLLLWACASASTLAAPPVAAPLPSPSFPWKDGEVLDYNIRWGALPAATARFAARQSAPGRWRFDLDLRSAGMVETLSPIRDHFRSTVEAAPWRSVGFDEERTEGSRVKQDRTRIDYAAGTGAHRELPAVAPKLFPIPSGPLDDLGSMLYGLRRGEWNAKDVRPLRVYDGPEVHRAEAAFLRREKIGIDGIDAPIPCLVLQIRPIYDEAAKNAKGYHVTLWLRDDATRLPLRAELKARFGTFTLQYVPPVPPINP